MGEVEWKKVGQGGYEEEVVGRFENRSDEQCERVERCFGNLVVSVCDCLVGDGGTLD